MIDAQLAEIVEFIMHFTYTIAISTSIIYIIRHLVLIII